MSFFTVIKRFSKLVVENNKRVFFSYVSLVILGITLLTIAPIFLREIVDAVEENNFNRAFWVLSIFVLSRFVGDIIMGVAYRIGDYAFVDPHHSFSE